MLNNQKELTKREERKELLIQYEELQNEKTKVRDDLRTAGELLQRLGNAIATNPDWLKFSNCPGFTFSAELLQAPSFDFKSLPDYRHIADNVHKHQQLSRKQMELKRRLGG